MTGCPHASHGAKGHTHAAIVSNWVIIASKLIIIVIIIIVVIVIIIVVIIIVFCRSIRSRQPLGGELFICCLGTDGRGGQLCVLSPWQRRAASSCAMTAAIVSNCVILASK